MTQMGLLRRFADLPGWKRMLVLEALLLLGVASFLIRFLPFRWLARLASCRRWRPDAEAHAAAPVVWAVEATASRVPWKVVCFQRALAGHWMLRRRGLPSLLHYGVAPHGQRGLSGHVWLSVADEIVIGRSGIDGHVRVACFPPAAP